MKISEPGLASIPQSGEWVPRVIAISLCFIVGLFAFLSYIALNQSASRSIEQKRADILQTNLNALRNRSEEDRKFFDIVRQIMIAQSDQDRKALIDQLKNVHFTPQTTSTTEVKKALKAPTTTTMVSKTSTTTQPHTTPSSTTTTTKPTPSTIVCVTNPISNICR